MDGWMDGWMAVVIRSAFMSMGFLGEKAGASSLAGGSLFLFAILVAATAPPPQVVCEDGNCEV